MVEGTVQPGNKEADAAREAHAKSVEMKTSDSAEAALQKAQEAYQQLEKAKDFATQAESLIFQTQLKLLICKETKKPAAMSLLQSAQKCVNLTKEHRPDDHLWNGEAKLVLAETELYMKYDRKALDHAKEAAVSFRNAGENKKRGFAICVGASAEARRGQLKSALALHEKAMAVLEEAAEEGDAYFKYASDVLKEIDELSDRPTDKYGSLLTKGGKAEGEDSATYEGAEGQKDKAKDNSPSDSPTKPQEEKQTAQETEEEKQAKQERERLVKKTCATIQKVVHSMIGTKVDFEDPLLQNGFSSNMTVWLQEEMSKELPGTNLPATLVYDYPTIAEMSDFIVDERLQATTKRK